MKTFSKYLEYNDIFEAIGIVDGKLVFNYNKIAPSDDEISSRFGKKTKGEKFVPYLKKIETRNGHKIHSVYSTKGVSKADIIKAIKHQSDINIDNSDYDQFINRTAIYIDYKLIRKGGVEVIIIPKSSSFILRDLLNNLAKRNPGVTIIYDGFKKNDPTNINIDYKHSKITPKIIKTLEREIERAKKNGYFEMKKIYKPFTKFITNLMKLTPNTTLRNIEGKNVAILDDVAASGSTFINMISNLEMYSPKDIMTISIFK